MTKKPSQESATIKQVRVSLSLQQYKVGCQFSVENISLLTDFTGVQPKQIEQHLSGNQTIQGGFKNVASFAIRFNWLITSEVLIADGVEVVWDHRNPYPKVRLANQDHEISIWNSRQTSP